MGCTSGNYGPQDKLFGAEIEGYIEDGKAARGLALISNVLDSIGNPYGSATGTDASGHAKPMHLQENPVCAMAGHAALVTMILDGTQRDSATNGLDNGLWTNMLFPYDGSKVAGAVGGVKYPGVLINNTALGTTGLGCVDNTAVTTGPTAHTYICPLTMNNTIVTFQGKHGGVVGVKFLESSWPTSTTNYQLELDDQNWLVSGGGSKNTSRIVIAHSTVPEATSPASNSIRVAFLVVTDDNATTGTAVYNILHNATFNDDTDPGNSNGRLEKVTFNSSYEPLDEFGNSITQLQVQRSKSVQTDVGVAMKNVGAGEVAIFPSLSPNTLQMTNASYVTSSLSGPFWLESQHTIH